MIILLPFSFLAGLVTVLSPCVLPVLPILLSVGIGQERYRPYGIISGLILSFAFFTLSLSAIVHTTGISPDILRYIAIFFIAFFGLTMLFPSLGNFFAAHTSGIANLGNKVQEKSEHVSNGFWSGFLVGCALGLLWTPCAGPILAAITTLAATSSVALSTIFITLAYVVGAAVPMFLIMYGGNKIIYSTNALAQYSEVIRKTFGVLMIIGALSLAVHADRILLQFAAKYFPMITIENNELIKKELEKLNPNKNKDFLISENNTELPAPEFVGIQEWINSSPLTLQELRSKVVLVDFWTYSCINCVRTLPYLKKWYDTYKDLGLVIVGIHTPEFEFEKNGDNVRDAVKHFAITYPVALDNMYKTWLSYNNRYWPAHYLVDQKGIVRETHFGEGGYTETENAIRKLLGLPPLSEKLESKEDGQARLTPETYLGYARGNSYQSGIVLQHDQIASYDYAEPLEPDAIGLKGSWRAQSERITAENDAAILELNFVGQQVYLVTQSPTAQLIPVLLDGKPVPAEYRTSDMNEAGEIKVHEARMYHILDLKNKYGRHTLTLRVPQSVSLYAFTFG